MYTQLDFCPRSPRHHSLLEQAEFLLRDLVAGRVHKFPCNCGACIDWAYRRVKRGEGRLFSAKTVFVYFLRTAFLKKTLANTRSVTVREVEEEAWRRNEIAWYADLRDRPRIVPIVSGYFVYWDEVRKATKSQTLDAIKKLAKAKQPPAAKMFLRGILNKKSFYTYYNRAGDAELGLIVRGMRKKLGSMVER
ncbi:MAG: hypothetical protein ABSG73_00405 [Candidatus Aminicenantales bacterium]